MYQAWPWGGTAAAAPSPTSGFVQPATATGQVAAAATQWPAGYSQYAVTPEMQQQWAAWASQAQYAYSSTLPVGQVPTTTSYTTGYPEYQTAPNETKVSEASGKDAQSSAEKPKNPAEELVPSDSSELEKLKQLKEQAQQWKSQNLQQPAAASWPYSTAASNVSQTSTATTVSSSESSFKSHAIASTNTSDPGNAQQMDKDEEEFERQFKDWEKQFEAWKEQNINHPDKEAFAQYEKQWQEWRAQLLQKKEQMQKAKAERQAAAKTGGTDVQSVQPSTVVTSTVPGLNTINTQASIPSVPNVADPAVATAAASNSNLYYQTPQYMYMQPYVYPSTVPVVPPAVPQQYPYSGQGVTAPTGDNFVNQTQTVPPTGGPPPLSVPPPPINNPSMNIKNTKDFERNKEPFQYGQIRKDAPSQDTYQNFEGFENSNTYAPETDEQFKWNSGRGRARGRGRGRGRGTRGRGVGRWSENEAENRPGESLNKGPPGFHDNSGNFNENVTDGSAPPFEYPSEDFQGDSQFPKEQPGPRQNPPPGGRFPYQEEPRTYPPDGFDESFPPPAFERFPPDSERERFPPNSERDSFPPGPERGSFPPGPKRGPFPPGPERGAFPPGPERGPFPPGPDRGSFPPGPERGPFPPGPERGPFPPGPERGPFPPGPERGPFPPGPDRGPFPPGPDRGPFPPGPDRGPFPPGPDRGPFPPGPDRGPFPPGPERGPFPPGPERGPFPPGPPERGRFPPGPNRDRFPPGPEREGFPPGPQRKRFAPGPDQDSFPPGHEQDRFPPGPERDRFSKGPERERFPPGPERDRFPPGPDRDRFPPGPPGPEHDRFPPGPERDRFPPGRKGEGFPPGPEEEQFPPGPEGEQFPPAREREPLLPGNGRERFPPGLERERFPPGPDREGFPPGPERERFGPGADRERFPPGPERDGFPPMPMEEERFMMERDFDRYPPEEDMYGPPPFREEFPPFDDRFPPGRGRFPGRGRRFPRGEFDRFGPPPPFASGMQEDSPYGPPEFPPPDERFGFPGDGPIPPRMPPGRGILRAPFEPGFGPGPGPAGRGRFPDDRFFGERPPHFKSIDYTHKPASDVMGEDYDPHYEYESEFQSDVMQYRVFDYSHRRERSPLIREPPFIPERNGERPPVPFREREREPFRERDRNRDRDLDRDRGRKDNRERDRDNRERDRDNRERDRDNRDRDRDRERDRERERERDRERDQKRDRDRDWDRDRHKDESEREKRLKWDNNQENARNYAKDKVSNNSKKEMEVKNVDTTFKLPPEIFKNDISETALIEDLLIAPKRLSRPKQLVIILRGLPGSGKTYVAKLIKDKEIENGGSAPRILSLDDYFMVETEVTDIDSDTGKRIKRKEFKFEYESGMEEVYRSSLFKSFKKTIDDRFFPFIIVDAVHDKSKQYEQYWSYAKQRGFQVYIAEMDCKDPVICHKRNIHNRSLSDITKILENWEPKPRHFMSIDVRSLLQDVAITEVEMEVESSDKKEDDAKDENAQENDAEESSSFLFHVPSRWEKLEATEEKLDQLDGLRISKKKHSSMEDYLQLPDDYEERKCEPGKKRVRWADLEERKEQDRLRAIGFVVGQTDWTKLTDPTHADRALTKTKYF